MSGLQCKKFRGLRDLRPIQIGLMIMIRPVQNEQVKNRVNKAPTYAATKSSTNGDHGNTIDYIYQ